MVDEATSGVACVAGVVLDEATSEATSRVVCEPVAALERERSR